MKNPGRATMLTAAALMAMLSVTACSAEPSAGGSPAATAAPDSSSTSNSTGPGSQASGSGTSSSGTSGSGTSGSGTSGSGTSGSGTSGSGTSGSGTSGSGTSSAGGSGAGGSKTAECLTRDLRVSDEAGPKPGPGLRHTEYLVFENVSAKACTIQGYPGVSFVMGDSGTQVGSAFVRTSAAIPSTRLAPGHRAYAPITLTEAPNACSPAEARGYRVYPPDETHFVFVSHPQLACTAAGQSVGAVAPITAQKAG